METSPTIENLAAALAKFQGQVSNVKKDGVNPFFKSKYATLENVIATVRGSLQENGLAFSQFPTGENELATILMHSSGEFIRATAKMNPKDNTPQGQGSAITYLRRYALSAILGIATEEDDDGNAASEPPKQRMAPYKVAPKPPQNDVELTPDEAEVLEAKKEHIKELCAELGEKNTKGAIKKLTGIEPSNAEIDTIIQILEKRVQDKIDTIIQTLEKRVQDKDAL